MMTGKLTVVSPDTSLLEAARLLVTLKIHCLPVLTGDVLVGIVTTTDVLRGFMRLWSGEPTPTPEPTR